MPFIPRLDRSAAALFGLFISACSCPLGSDALVTRDQWGNRIEICMSQGKKGAFKVYNKGGHVNAAGYCSVGGRPVVEHAWANFGTDQSGEEVKGDLNYWFTPKGLCE